MINFRVIRLPKKWFHLKKDRNKLTSSNKSIELFLKKLILIFIQISRNCIYLSFNLHGTNVVTSVYFYHKSIYSFISVTPL